GRTGAVSRSARIQLVSLVGIFVLLKVVAYWLDRFELLSHTRGGNDGGLDLVEVDTLGQAVDALNQLSAGGEPPRC
ncbi:MAG: hypothetical protein WCE29_12205, partial [Mycobacterium sp.]